MNPSSAIPTQQQTYSVACKKKGFKKKNNNKKSGHQKIKGLG
jgi:hypothetical protein